MVVINFNKIKNMKNLLTCITIISFATGVFAQGSINVDNSVNVGGLSIGTTQAIGQGNYFYGNYTLQVWYLNGTLPSNVTSDSNLNTTGLAAYNNLTTDGFTLGSTFADENITARNAGVFSLGELDMPAADSTVTLALAAWTSGANGNSVTVSPTFAGAAYGGVFAFSNPTADYLANPEPTPSLLSGWDGPNDLVMVTSVPEPTTMALAGLGGLSLFLARRKKNN